MKGGLSNEVVSDEGEINMGHISTYSRLHLQQGCFFHEGGLSKGVLLY